MQQPWKHRGVGEESEITFYEALLHFQTNLGIENTEDVDSFRPCMELDVGDNLVPLERQGETVDLLAAERNSQTAPIWYDCMAHQCLPSRQEFMEYPIISPALSL